jgi:hypothetical protein
MPLSNAMLVTTAVGFGLSMSVGQALAANSQPPKVYPSNTISVKGGASTKHKTSAGESTLSQASHAPDVKEAPVAANRFAAGADDSRGPEQHH